MRTIDKIVWHCTATPEGRAHSAAEIRDWHVNGRGWSDIGYHYVIGLDGRVEDGRPVHTPGAHVRGHNRRSIGIAYVGGVSSAGQPKDTRTPAQKVALYDLTAALLKRHPGAVVMGHNELDSGKACPSFDAHRDWSEHLRGREMPAGAPGSVMMRQRTMDAGKRMADPAMEAARKPAVKATGALAGVGAVAGPVAARALDADWQTLAVAGGVSAVVLIALALIFRDQIAARLA